MKKMAFWLMMLMASVALTGCDQSDYFDDLPSENPNDPSSSGFGGLWGFTGALRGTTGTHALKLVQSGASVNGLLYVGFTNGVAISTNIVTGAATGYFLDFDAIFTDGAVHGTATRDGNTMTITGIGNYTAIRR